VLQVLRQVHGRHASTPDLAAETVVVTEATPDALSNLFANGHEPCAWKCVRRIDSHVKRRHKMGILCVDRQTF
jgi:hypothetical protein